ncbi:hypothetical protein BC833DRAFT_435936 [Globomyces pollinis-pini]|nr:hypothetical protein BC833DRAFT_435936 [Globomyces pollinis-pini]
MLMLVWLLMVPVFAEFKFIVGSLWFYSNCSNSFLPDKQVKLIPNTPIVGNTNLIKLNWIYPNNAINLLFFNNSNSKLPYANITGPNYSNFGDSICNLSENSHYHSLNIQIYKNNIVNNQLFQSNHSFILPVLSGNIPDQIIHTPSINKKFN